MRCPNVWNKVVDEQNLRDSREGKRSNILRPEQECAQAGQTRRYKRFEFTFTSSILRLQKLEAVFAQASPNVTGGGIAKTFCGFSFASTMVFEELVAKLSRLLVDTSVLGKESFVGLISLTEINFRIECRAHDSVVLIQNRM
jgi:hypothetical protein